MQVDLVLAADQIHTGEPADTGRAYQAVGIRGGVISALGVRTDIRDWTGPATEVVDLGSATLTAGLTDGHLHPTLGAESTQGVGLLAADGPAAVLARLRSQADATAVGDWVRAWGLNPNTLDGRPMTAALIEDAVRGRPAIIRLFDGHGALVSNAALAAAGLDGPRVFGDAAQVVCDDEGSPTGLLLEESAVQLVEQVAPALDPREVAQKVLADLTAMAQVGLTGGHAMDLQGQGADLLALVEDGADLPLRLRCSPWVTPTTSPEELDELIARQGTGGRRWRVGGAKLFVDGTVDHGTAWLTEPDSCGASTHSSWPDPSAYAAALATLSAAGVSTATHAIGDAGVAFALEAIAAAPGRAPHRIEHIETIPDETVRRFGEVRVVASVQPTHCTDYGNADYTDNWSVRLGPERARRGWRTGDLARVGVPIVLGSDWPVAHFDPRGVMVAARLRRPAGASDAAAIGIEQALDARAVLDGFTRLPAISVGEGALGGTITVGKRADFTAFTLDPLVADADEVAHAPIVLTVVDGRITHRADVVS